MKYCLVREWVAKGKQLMEMRDKKHMNILTEDQHSQSMDSTCWISWTSAISSPVVVLCLMLVFLP